MKQGRAIKGEALEVSVHCRKVGDVEFERRAKLRAQTEVYTAEMSVMLSFQSLAQSRDQR